eukprot:Em0020g892a
MAAELPSHSFSRKVTVSRSRRSGTLRNGRSLRSTQQHQHTLFTFSTLPDIASKISKPHQTASSVDVCDGSEDCVLDRLETEAAIQAAFCTIAQVKPEEPCRKEMKDYVSKVFALSPQSLEQQEKEAAEMLQKSNLTLMCTLVNYEQDDTSSDTNSSLNWFCVIGILSDEHRSSKAVRTDQLVDWKEQNLVDKVFTSSIQPQNETIELPVHNLGNEWLVIEVWSKDGGQNRLQKIRKLLQHKECYFVGRTFFKLQNVSSQLEMKRFELYSHSTKHKRGYIKCSISLKRDDVANLLLAQRLKGYRALLTSVVLHECKKTQEGQGSGDDGGERCLPQWDAQLNPAAKNLLKLHAEFCSLSEFQQVALQFCVLYNCRKCSKHLIQQSALELLLDTITKLSPNAVPSDETENGLRSELFKNLQDFLSIILKPVNDHLVMLNIKDTSSVTILKNNLVLIQKLYNNRPFVNSLPQPYPQSFELIIETAIKKSTAQWCVPILTNCAKLVDQAEYLQIDAVDPVRAFSRHCLNQCEMVQEYLLPLFQREFHFNYFNPFLQTLDAELHTVATMIEVTQVDTHLARREETLVSLYEVYITFQRVKAFCKHLDSSVFETPDLCRSYSWFEAFVPKWIKLALARCKDRIQNAVKEDKVVKMMDEVSYSSSLIDSVSFLGQMVAFWKNLDWPNLEQSYGFIRFLVTCIIEAAQFYIDLIYQKSLSIGMATATTELCIALNDMQEMLNRLEAKESGTSLMNDLHLENFFMCLDGSNASGLGNQARVYVKSLVDNAVEDVRHKIVVLTEQLGQNFNSSIKQQLQEAIMETGKESPDATEASIHSLEQYLNDNLSTLSENLFFDVFKLLLIQVWTTTIRAVVDLTLGPRMKWRSYERLYHTLKALQAFFNANGEGLSNDELETEEYKTLYAYLRMHRLPTEMLILKYCESLAEDQSTEGVSADLSLSVAYVADQVELSVVENNIPLTKTRGRVTNDPGETLCAQLFVLPEEYDAANSSRNAQRKTKGRSIHMCSSRPQAVHELSEMMHLPVIKHYEDGTILVLCVYLCSSNRRGKNEFIGYFAISMKQITDTRRTFSLHFLHPKESDMFKEILSRRENFQDKTAAKFIESLASHCILPLNSVK